MNTVSVTPMTYVTRSVPECFGKEWNSTAPECAGGADSSFKDDAGKHVRPRCGYFGVCSTATATAKQGLISPQTLIRPQPSLHMPTAPLPMFTPQPMQPQVTSPAQPQGMPPRPAWMPPVSHPPVAPPSVTDWRTIEQQRLAGLGARPAYPQQYVQPQQYPTQFAAPTAAHYPAQTWQVGNAMPAYLTVEDVRQPGENWFFAMLLNIIRGIIKAASHSTARYADITPFRELPPRS